MEKIKCEICGGEFEKLGNHLYNSHPEITSEQYYRQYLMKNSDEGICPVCGKPTVFLGLTKGYRSHCSTRCSSLDKDVLSKLQSTTLDRYGVINIWLLPKYQQKAHECTSTLEALEKRKQTNLKHLGVEFPAQSKAVQEKLKITSLEKYGTEYHVTAPSVVKKRKETMMKNHGVEHNWASKNPKLNGKQYWMDNYGVTNCMQVREFHVKAGLKKSTSVAEDGTKLDSSWEVAVWNYCLHNNIEIKRGPKIFYDYNNKKHVTYIDFNINGGLYEVKGPHLLEGCYDDRGVPIEEKLKIYRENNVIVISKDVEKYSYDNKYSGIKFIDIDNLEVLNG